MEEIILLGFEMVLSAELFSEIDWSLVGAIATIGAIIAAFAIYYLQKSKKRLSYEIISNTQLVGVNNKIQDNIKILYDENQVVNVHLISIRFINNGNEPISVDDFNKPINIRYNSNINILKCEVVEKIPKELDVVIIKKEKTLEVEPLLLNTKDEFTVNILASDFSGNIDIYTRIKGVKEVEVYKSYEKPPMFLVYANIFIVLLLIINFFYGKKIDSYFGIDYNDIVYSPVFSFFMIFILVKLSLRTLKK